MLNKNICIIRNTFGDRCSFLRISLEYQEQADLSDNFFTYIFIDPHPDYGFINDYNEKLKHYKKIVFSEHQERKSWYSALDYIFSNFDYEFVLSIEDDVIISKDYLKLCLQIIEDKILDKNQNILYFHAGAWEKPKGDPNKILKSGASSRSVLINKRQFNVIKEFVKKESLEFKIGNDNVIKKILDYKNMITIAPEFNRHGHFGIYGWSSLGKHRDIDGKKSLFDNSIGYEDLYNILKKSCLLKDELNNLNLNRNPRYFWDFDPNINFDSLIYPKF